MKFFIITFISYVLGKTFIIKTVGEGSPHIHQLEAGEEYSEEEKDNKKNENEDHEPSRYKETKDLMESKG